MLASIQCLQELELKSIYFCLQSALCLQIVTDFASSFVYFFWYYFSLVPCIFLGVYHFSIMNYKMTL